MLILSCGPWEPSGLPFSLLYSSKRLSRGFKQTVSCISSLTCEQPLPVFSSAFGYWRMTWIDSTPCARFEQFTLWWPLFCTWSWRLRTDIVLFHPYTRHPLQIANLACYLCPASWLSRLALFPVGAMDETCQPWRIKIAPISSLILPMAVYRNHMTSMDGLRKELHMADSYSHDSSPCWTKDQGLHSLAKAWMRRWHEFCDTSRLSRYFNEATRYLSLKTQRIHPCISYYHSLQTSSTWQTHKLRAAFIWSLSSLPRFPLLL